MRVIVFLFLLLFLFPVVFSSTFIDEEGEEMITTAQGFDIRAQHPRITVPSEGYLGEVISRMYGNTSRNPYEKWFNKIRELADKGESLTHANLALLYLATGNETYRDEVLQKLKTSSGKFSSISELYAIDLLYDEIPNSTKLHLLRRADQNEFHYNSLDISKGLANERWGYHAFHKEAVMFSSIFAYTDILDHQNISNSPQEYEFDVNNYLGIAYEAVSPNGRLWKYERAVGGDMNFRDGLQGSYGGMYDNFGYDQSEEKDSIYTISALSFLTKQPLYDDFLRDKYKGKFYQFFYYPHTRSQQEGNVYCREDGSYSQRMALIWNTQSGTYVPQPSTQTVALRAFVFKDPKMQYFADYGHDIFQCGDTRIAGSMFWDLLFYDDSIEASFPNENPTSSYFSGPGLVSTRSSWNDTDSLFSVFVSGDAISRRYTDANSFLLSRNSDLIMHAGARFRNQKDNMRHFWLTQRSAAKNTMKIFDPNECLDRNYSNFGYAGSLCSGPQLYDSENLGGQMFVVGKASSNLDYPTYSSMPQSTPQNPYGITNYDMGEIKKYEFVEGDFSYAQGDATKAYTKKINFFEREFLFIYPNKVIIFDRVESINPEFEKRWTIHTGPKPQPEGEVVSSNLGYKSYNNISRSVFENDVDKMVIDSLFPKTNTIHVRGGKEIHLQNESLFQGEVLLDLSIEMDISRWVEVLVSGNDLEGTITITGDAQEGNDVSEQIVFDGTRKSFFDSRPSSMSQTSLTDQTQNWKIDQWKGYMVRTSGPTNYAVITGNSPDTLYVENFEQVGSPWRYEIFKGVSNSFYHWDRIDSIRSDTLNLTNILVQTPHEFDTVDAKGNVYSFSPHTYGPDSGLMRREPYFLGRWSFEVEAATPQKLDNFLHIITVDDPSSSFNESRRLENSDVRGGIVDGKGFLFARNQSSITQTSLPLFYNGSLDMYIFNVVPDTSYYYSTQNSTLSISENQLYENTVQSSSMGVIKLDSLQFSSFQNTNVSNNSSTSTTDGNTSEDNSSSENDSTGDSTTGSSSNSGGSGSSSSSGSSESSGSSYSGSSGGGGSLSSGNSDSSVGESPESGSSDSDTSSYVAPSCQSDFSYSAWSSCVDGTQFRIVEDLNSCVESTQETRTCTISADENELKELNAKEIQFAKINNRRYGITFNDTYNEMVYTNEKLEDESFVVVDSTTKQQYLGTLVNENQGRYYYTLERIDQNNLNTLKEEGLAERSLTESLTSSFEDFKNSRNFIPLIYLVILFVCTFLLYFITRYVKKIHR